MSDLFFCSHCDAQFPKWQGQCNVCDKWGTVRQEQEVTTGVSLRRAAGVSLQDVQQSRVDRLQTRLEEVDRVLGGGLVPGAVVLLSGEPGVGKSTLVMQVAGSVAQTAPVVYASGEESEEQIARRAQRMNIASQRIFLVATTGIASILAAAEHHKPGLLIIDSLQTTSAEDVSGEVGSPTQMKAVVAKITSFAKKHQLPVLVIGHVTKEGKAAGPKTIEHLVDVALFFEGDRSYAHRLLRSHKNRFGATGEVGVFAMRQDGLRQITNPSEYFLSKRQDHVAGTAVCPILEGTRVFCIDVQALVEKTTFSTPRRTASGYDTQRLNVLLAVLAKHAGQDFKQFDVMVNMAGGLRVREPAADAAVCAALVSAKIDLPLPQNVALFGEVGLAGEVRPVAREEERIAVASKLGYHSIFTGPGKAMKGVVRVTNLGQALRGIFGK